MAKPLDTFLTVTGHKGLHSSGPTRQEMSHLCILLVRDFFLEWGIYRKESERGRDRRRGPLDIH